MKIRDVNNLNNLIKTGLGPERPVHTNNAANFKDVMSSLNHDNYMERLTEMSVDIEKQGEIVGRRYDILELKRLKEMIADYLYAAIRYMYEFRKQSTVDARGRHRIYAIIKKINKKLEEMTQKMLQKEMSGIELMAAIDDIRGMLLDILM